MHPDLKTVIPIAPEPIVKQDGVAKNDCELNASKRLMPMVKTEHPHLKIIIVADALSANAPYVNLCRENNFLFRVYHWYSLIFSDAIALTWQIG